jgi:hypothetical protein
MMIPHDRILLDDDGHGWWTPAECGADRACAMMPDDPCITHARHFDHPCYTCGGHRYHLINGGPAIIGCDARCIDGRHTWTAEIEPVDCSHAWTGSYLDGDHCLKCGVRDCDEGQSRSVRLSVVPGEVRLIGDDDTMGEGFLYRPDEDDRYLVVGGGLDQELIRLPDAAKPGESWAVRVRWENVK